MIFKYHTLYNLMASNTRFARQFQSGEALHIARHKMQEFNLVRTDTHNFFNPFPHARYLFLPQTAAHIAQASHKFWI